MSATDTGDSIHPESVFLERLHDHNAVLWVATIAEYGDAECIRPKDWQTFTCDNNEFRLSRYHLEYAHYVAVNTGLPFVVFDCDTKNGCDVEKVRALLKKLGVRIYAEMITPSGGTHFYVRGHPDLVTVHSKKDDPKLADFPGLDIQSFGANVWAPGTFRRKYGFFVGGYTIVYDHLDQLTPDDAADDGTEALVDWVAEQSAHRIKAKASKTPGGAREWTWDLCPPWDGTPPDARQQAYLDKALTNEADKVGKTADGGRNDALFRSALKLGSLIAGAGLDEQQVIAALQAAAVTNGYTATDGEHATNASIRSGLRAGKKNPRAVPEGPERFFSKSGLLALNLADAVMRSVTCGFGYPDRRFYTYGNGVWSLDEDSIRAEITELLGNRYRVTHTGAVLDLIKYSPGTARITDEPLAEYVNAPNGMIAWNTGDLLAHSPDYRCTVQLPVEYHPDAQCPLFEKFVAEVLPKDLYEPTGSGLGFIWELIGYTLYSGNPLHVAILLWGKGRNGKGTLIRVLRALLGEHNCSTVGLHQLVENRFRAATLFGKLANLAGDLDSKWVDNTAMFKAITGGDTVQAEHKYGAPFDFTPWALPFYSINKAFGSADSSEAWVARWVVVPFPTSFLGREDRTLTAKLTSPAELQGILRRGIEALPALMTRGRFIEPGSLKDAKAAFVIASDAIRAWLNERCVLGLKEWTPRPDLYDAYWGDHLMDGSKALSRREFYNRVEQVSGISINIHNGIRGFAGVRLLGSKRAAAPQGAERGAG